VNYKIISTGSKGNSVVIGKTMIDCGVPFKTIKESLYDVNTLLLTHIHSDHIKASTLKNIVIMFPHIKIFGNYEVCQVFDEYPIQCINADVPFKAADIVYTPFKCIHDVLTYGYVWDEGEVSIFYATDTSDLEHAPRKKYDYIFLESNHDEKKVETIQFDTRFGYNVYAGAKRHLSTQKAKSFYYMNRRGPGSVFVELHQSSRFY
jgi:phosphoribosyl 1,2-cyclic phosphodiesterase